MKRNKTIQDKIIITNELPQIRLVRGIIFRNLRRANLPSEYINRIILAADEAIANIVEHAYPAGQQGRIDVRIKIDGEKVQIKITDNGKSFNPDLVEKPNIRKWVKQGRKKGLGIFLMKQAMDEVKYTFKTGQNQLLLVKYIKNKPEKEVKGV